MNRDNQTPNLPFVSAEGWMAERTRLAVGRNVNVSGHLIFQEPIRIEGSFKGEVHSVDLVVISKEAKIDGSVKAPRVHILGQLLNGLIEAERVLLGPESSVDGTICAAYLTVQEGAIFNGVTRMIATRQRHARGG